MSRSTRLLQRAIELSRTGCKTDARHLLQALLREEPTNEIAWLWYVDTFTTDPQRIEALQRFLEAFPDNLNGKRVLASLLQKQSGHPMVESAPVPPTEPVRASQSAPTRVRISLPAPSIQPSPIHQEPPRPSHPLPEIVHRRPPISTFLSVFLAGVILFLIATILVIGARSTLAIQSLNSRFNALNNSYTDLSGSYQSLHSDYNYLSQRYQSIQSDYADLTQQYQTIQADYTVLSQEYDYLDSIAVVPPYISLNGRQVTVAFKKTDGTLEYWQFPFDLLESHIMKGANTRRVMYDRNNELTLELADGSAFQDVDMREFIDSAPFESYIPALYQKTGGGEAFIREVWYMVTNLDTYVSEVGEIPRFPLETLVGGGGDCEDSAILYASMILAAPTNWTVKLVYMDTDNIHAPKTSNHVMPYIDTGSGTYLINTTSNSVMQPFPDGITGWFYTVHR
jgi:hypothetical protein